MRSLVVVALVLAARVGHASPRAVDADARARLAAARTEIRSHVHALRYAEARDAAREALGLGAAGPTEVAELARTLAETSAALDDTAGAERWFLLLLMLQPAADLPPGASPKLREPLAAARGKAAALAVTPVIGASTYSVTITGDVAGVATQLAIVTTDRAGVRRTTTGAVSPGHAFTVPVTAELAGIEVSVRDRDGNELIAGQAEAAPAVVATPPQPARRRSLFRRPLPYIVGTVVTAGLGGVFLWRREVAKDALADILANSAQHTFSDAEAARGRAERYGWLSVASVAAAGVLATTAVLLALQGTDERSVVVTPSTTGVSVLLTSPF